MSTQPQQPLLAGSNHHSIETMMKEGGGLRSSIVSAFHGLLGSHLTQYMDINVRNLDTRKLAQLKSDLHHLVVLANKYDFKIDFKNLQHNKSDRCCVWFSGHKWNPQEEFEQLARAVSSTTIDHTSTLEFNILY